MEVEPEREPDRDNDTANRLRQRDPRALRWLLEDYGGQVQCNLRREFASSLGDNEIDEALNLAAHRVWRSANTYDSNRGTLRAWFYVIARNSALDVLKRERRARRDAQPAATWDMAAQMSLPTGDLVPSETQQQYLDSLNASIERLPPLQMAIIKADLRAGDKADASDLALRYHTTRNSIYASRSIARKTLRRYMTELGCVPPTTTPGIEVSS